ncbi:MAG: hypothetical protein JW798_01215, partial [Prolixibacteraceae bacterium]|nr:hypothetical protein [Prolixibacteraceae bacterium]
MEKNTKPIEFIMAVAEHRVFGLVLIPYLVRKNIKGTFYQALGVAKLSDEQFEGYTFNDTEKKLLALVEKYSDENLARKFARKKSTKEFLDTLETGFFQQHVAPYIDKQIVEAIGLVDGQNIRLFYKASNYTNFYDEDEVKIMPGYALPVFHFDLTPGGLTYFLKVKYETGNLDILLKKPLVLTNTPASIILGNRLYRFRQLAAKKLTPFLQKENISVPPSLTEKYLKTFVYHIVSDFEVEAEGFDILKVTQPGKAIISIEQGMDLAPMLVLYFQYGSKRFIADNKNETEVMFSASKGKYVFQKYIRNFEWEGSVKIELEGMGMKLVNNQLELLGDRGNDLPGYQRINWINEHEERLKKSGIDVDQASEGARYHTGVQAIDHKLKLEDDWFDLYVIVKFGEYQIPFIRLRKNILKGVREFILPNGEVAILPKEWFARYGEI